MKLFGLSLFCGLFCISGKIISKTLEEFATAIVYSGNVAEVQRVVFANETFEAGEFHSVSIKGFSPKTLEETVRIKGTVDSEILDFTLLAVQTHTTIGGISDDTRANLTVEFEEYRKSITALSLKKQALELEMSNANSRLKIAQDMISLSTKFNKTVAEATEILNFYSQELVTHRTLITDNTFKVDGIDANIQNLTTLMNQVRLQKNQQGRSEYKQEQELIFRFRAVNAVTVENPLAFSVTYMVPGASWAPEYDIRIENNKNNSKKTNTTLYRMEIDYFANVWQNSDEHWVDTELTLSTSNPSILNKHPEPRRRSVAIEIPGSKRFFTHAGQSVRFESATSKSGSGSSAWTPSVCPSAVDSHVYGSFDQPSCQPSAVPSAQPSAQPTGSPSRMPSCQPTSQPTSVPTVVPYVVPSVAPSAMPTVEPTAVPSAMPTSSPSSIPSFLPTVETGYKSAAQSAYEEGVNFDATASESMASSNSISLGDIGASHMFQIPYPVTVYSKDLLEREIMNGNSSVNRLLSHKQLILIEKVVIEDTQLFTYSVPSQNSESFLMGWGKYSTNCSQSEVCTIRSPLLASSRIQVRIQGDNVGTIPEFESVQPGQIVKLNLGIDKHIHIQTTAVVPTHKGEEEDKSTWFVRDKKKYRVRIEERMTTMRSSHTTQEVLVVISENLPRSTDEDDITVELLSPLMSDMQSVSVAIKNVTTTKGKDVSSKHTRGTSNTVGSDNDEYISAILQKEQTRTTLSTTSSAVSTTVTTSHVYYCKESGNIYWATWIKPGETVVVPFKYKIAWPEEKQITIM